MQVFSETGYIKLSNIVRFMINQFTIRLICRHTYEDYNTWEKTVGINYEDCRLVILINLLEGEYSYIDIFPIWKDEVDIQIIYDSNSKRPKRFLGEYKISNEPTVQMIFNN